MIADSEVDNCLRKKKDFADPVKDAAGQLQVFLFLTSFKSNRMTSHKHSLAA